MARATLLEKDLNDLSALLVISSAGDVIFKEGDEAADVFGIEDSRVEFVREEAGLHNGAFVDGRRVFDGREVELVDGAKVRLWRVQTVVRTPGRD